MPNILSARFITQPRLSVMSLVSRVFTDPTPRLQEIIYNFDYLSIYCMPHKNAPSTYMRAPGALAWELRRMPTPVYPALGHAPCTFLTFTLWSDLSDTSVDRHSDRH